MARPRNPKGMGSFRILKNGTYQWRQRKDKEERYIHAKTPGELREKIKEVADLPIIKEKITADEWFKKWLKNIESLNKPATYEQYESIYRNHIKPILGKKILKNIKKSDIQQVISKMNTKVVQKEKTDKEGKITSPEKVGLATWSMKHARKVMSLALAAALEDKLIVENPVAGIKIPKKQSKKRKTLKTSELKILFDYAKRTRWYWAFRFLLVTGLRRGELLALKWSDIDYNDRRIVVDESDSVSGVGDTKGSKVHYVPLPDLAIYYLGKQKEMLEDEVNPALHNDELKKADLIFPSVNGTLMKPDSFNSALDRINEKAGIHVTPHMFRHTYVYMNKGLMSLSELQEALGHDEATTTLDIYGTMLSDTIKVANKVDEAFKDLEGELNKIEQKKENAKVIDLSKRRKVNSV